MAAGNANLINSCIIGKKFDIRQWVLITSKQSYIFSHFYIKVCSKEYDLSIIEDHQAHLSNYTINKEKFASDQKAIESVYS